MEYKPFTPSLLLKNPYVQSILASKRIGGSLPDYIRSASQKIIINCKNGTKLSGIYTSHEKEKNNACVVILHGWEGSIDSRYAKGTLKFLFSNGYDIFRLNLRDHGDSHHLNKGLFFITKFDEIFQAVEQVSKLFKKKAIYIVGFSLGGNFALRIAIRHKKMPINGLKHVIAISPPINPELSTELIDNILLFKYYFLKKWKRSLQKKQQLFPQLYDFKNIFNMSSILEVTEELVDKYSEFKNAKEYFSGYTLLGNIFNEICIPTTVITAADDPIIPVNDFYNLKTNNKFNLIVHKHGGHLGFIENIFKSPWFDSCILQNLY